jgi:hypothetical protein
MDFRLPAPRTALQHVRVMQEAIEKGGDGARVAK